MHSLRRLATLFALALVVSCGESEGPTDPPGSALDDVTLSSSAARTFGKVYLAGLPAAKRADYEDYSVRILVEGAEPVITSVETDATGPYFHAILHPLTPNEGGPARVQIVHADATSPDRALQIEALPEAPGAYERLVNTLRTMVEQRAEWAGTTFEALAALEFDEVPDEHLALKYAQSYVEGGGGVDMVSLIDDEGGYLSAEQRELLDRVLGYARLDLVVQADIDEFEQEAPSRESLPTTAKELGRRACIDVGPTISTAQELVDAMVLAKLGDSALDPNGAGRYLEALGWALTGLGTVPGVGGTVATVAGVGVAVWQAAASGVRGVYPSELVDLTFEIDKQEFDEDTETPGVWSEVMLIARSQGWVADKSIVNVVLTTVSGYVSVTQTTQLEAMDALRDVGMAEWNMEAQSHFDENDGFVEFCSKQWSVDISDPDYSTAAALEGKFAVDRDAQTVTPLAIGTDALRIATVPGLFAGQNRQRDAALETEKITVYVSPAVIRVEDPGETVTVMASIQGAEVTSLYWDSGPGSWEDGTGDDTNEGGARPLKTPTNRNLYPFDVEVESTSRQGLRASGEPRRFDYVQIRLDEASISISPRDTCIQPGDTVQFEAEVEGLEDYEVVWSMNQEGYGSLSPTGFYQSLSQGSSGAIITAHIAGMEEIMDSTTVEARGCDCSFRGFIDAYPIGGSDVAVQSSNFGTWIHTFFFETPETESWTIGMSLLGDEDGPVIGNTDTWRVSFTFAVDGSPAWIASFEDDEPGVFLEIEEFTAAHIRGGIRGSVVQRDQEGNITASLPVSIDLQAGLMDGGWPCE